MKEKKRHSVRQIIMRVFIALFTVIIAIYLVGGVYAYNKLNEILSTKPTLNISDLSNTESSKIYDTNGNLITEVGTFYRENVTYDQLPESLVDAFLSIEDSRYFEHNGFDVPRFTQSVINTVLKGNMQGGSTFTMQLIKNTYFSVDTADGGTTRTANVEYKVQQIALALELEEQLDKKEIFTYYINKLNFGGRIRGAQKASEYYFGKNVTELNISESALLAGIVNLPNKYNPYYYLDLATNRRNEVLYQMLNHGYITEDEYNLAKSIKVEDLLVGEDKMQVESTKYAQYIDVVIKEAAELTGEDPVSTGMNIYTALNPTVQEKIESIEQENEGVYFTDDMMDTAMIAMNNKNGEIIGIGGGRNYEGGSLLLNRATQQFKQPGSTVKPILEYALAYEYLGYSLDEILEDKPIEYPAEAMVLVNSGGKYNGDVTVKFALEASLNIPAIITLEKVTAKIGVQAVVDYMTKIGFTNVSYDDYHMSYAIGGNTFTTSVKELAGAHAMIINGGVYNEPHTIKKVVMYDNTEYTNTNQNVQALSSGSAYLVSELLANNVHSNIGNYMEVLQKSYPTYGKTGTTDWGTSGLQYGIPEGAMKDKWMVSSSSNYTNVVWVGYDQAVVGGNNYFDTYKSSLNIPGNINSLLLDVESTIDGSDLSGVQKPEDVTEIEYLDGTYPHVDSKDVKNATTVKSLVSNTGLTNVPLVPYDKNNTQLTNFDVALYNNMFYINWNAQNVCNGGTKDISLKDQYNNVSEKGACLFKNGSLYSNKKNTYYADVYLNDKYFTTIKSSSSLYTGLQYYLNGKVQVCGYIENDSGKSEQVCKYVGDYSNS